MGMPLFHRTGSWSRSAAARRCGLWLMALNRPQGVAGAKTMSRDDPWDVRIFRRAGPPRLFCDLTRSWSAVGGGVGACLRSCGDASTSCSPCRAGTC